MHNSSKTGRAVQKGYGDRVVDLPVLEHQIDGGHVLFSSLLQHAQGGTASH